MILQLIIWNAERQGSAQNTNTTRHDRRMCSSQIGSSLKRPWLIRSTTTLYVQQSNVHFTPAIVLGMYRPSATLADMLPANKLIFCIIKHMKFIQKTVQLLI